MFARPSIPLALTAIALVAALGCGDDECLPPVDPIPDASVPPQPDAPTAPPDAGPDATIPPDAAPDAAPINLRPVAVVADQTANIGTRITVSGEQSSDPEGDPLTYRWTLRNAPPLSEAALDDATAGVVHFEADRAGVYVIDLVVNDGALDSTAATALITVFATDQAPVASAGPDRTVRIATTVVLSGLASRDPRGLNLSYRWQLVRRPAGSAAVLSSRVVRDVFFTTDVVGEYELELLVHNGSRQSEPDRVTITAVDVASPIPGDVRNGALNPDEVYLFGTLSEGACYRDAIAHWSAPSTAVVGFDCYADERSSKIRNDGTVLYTNTFEDKLREFHCDGCPSWTPGSAYPADVLANDPILPTTACDLFQGMSSFALGVAGRYVYSCRGRTGWFDEAGVQLPLTAAPLSIGFGGKALTATAIVDLTTGQSTPITSAPTGSTLAVRAASPTSFWLVTSSTAGVQRWRIGHDGTVALEGAYAAPPAGYSAGGQGKLDASGNLFQIGRGPATFEDVIVFRTITGLSEVVYTEASNPAVKIHISDLITGP